MIDCHSGHVCLLGLVGLLALGACGGSSSDAGRTVRDQAGRTCTIPEVSLTYSCDAAPKPSLTCTGAETPCFSRGNVGDPMGGLVGPAAVCAACCMGDQADTTEADCSQIVCTTVDDCPPGARECKGGGCY